MTEQEYWQAIYEAAKARDRDNADIFTENPYKRASDADKLKAENKQLKTECALLDDELRIARQETINVLNELKERIPLAMSKQYVCAQIDEMIKEQLKK